MKINAEGLRLLKDWEGCRLKAYMDGGGIWTIGWGHTGSGVKEGLVWTQAECDAALERDLNNVGAAVTGATKGVNLNENQFSALVCFAYNVGTGAFKTSTLLAMIRAGKLDEALYQFKRWNKINGKVSKGLTARRQAEAELFAKL